MRSSLGVTFRPPLRATRRRRHVPTMHRSVVTPEIRRLQSCSCEPSVRLGHRSERRGKGDKRAGRAAGVDRRRRPAAGARSSGHTPRLGPEVGEKQREPDEQLSWCS